MVPAAIIISYLIGSIPTAYIFGRIVKNIDIRRFGSGNVGATNAFRVLGPVWGMVVLAADILKGIIPVTLLAGYFLTYWDNPATLLRILLGLACICGHNWTLFLRFQGGKGVATTLGVLAGLGMTVIELRLALFIAVLVWLAVFWLFHIVSLASVLSALTLPVSMLILKSSPELLALSIILSIFVVIRHKKNLIGLMHGEEKPPARKIG
jgi:glycerol-3-phosphate acyltransferase PlsY